MLIKEQNNKGSNYSHICLNPVGLCVCVCVQINVMGPALLIILSLYVFPKLTGYEPAGGHQKQA